MKMNWKQTIGSLGVVLPLGLHTLYEATGHALLPGVSETMVDVVCGGLMLGGLSLLFKRTRPTVTVRGDD